MEILPAVRKFNTIALALCLVLAIGFMLVGMYESYRASEYENQFISSANANRSNVISGERIDAGDRAITLYARGEINGEAKTDLRFIDSRDGSTVRLGNDAQQEFYNGLVLGPPRRENRESGYGYWALAKTGERDGEPVFGAIFLRFRDMKTFTVASGILAGEETELDGKSFSVVMWDAQDRGKFILFDSELGKIVTERDLDMDGRLVSERQNSSAPVAKFQ